MNITVRTEQFDIEANLDIRIEEHITAVYWKEWDWYFYGDTISDALDKSQKLIMNTLKDFEQKGMLKLFLDKFNMIYKTRVTFISDVQVKAVEQMMYTIDTIG